MKVTNVRRGAPNTSIVALMDVEFDEGWVINDCAVLRRTDGNLRAIPPILRDGRRAVKIPDELWFPFVNNTKAAVRCLVDESEPADEPADAGVMRFLSAEEETCELAGL